MRALRLLPSWLTAVAVGLSAQAIAQPWPVKPVRLLVPFSAGGVTDLFARGLAQRLGDALGQPVVVDNRPGGNTIVAYEILVRAGSDGYTLMFEGFNGMVLNPLLYPKLPYSAERDLAPAALVGFSPFVLVVPATLPAKTVPDLIELARSQPGKLNFGSSGNGGVIHVATEWFMALTGTRMQHVPYKGGASALPDLVSGQIQVLFNPPISAIPLVKAGKLRALAVTSRRRLVVLPDVPTVAELGWPGYDAATWFAVIARRGSPPAVIERLSAEVRRIVAAGDLRDQFAAQVIEIVYGTPEDVAALVRKDTARWGEVIRRAAITIDP